MRLYEELVQPNECTGTVVVAGNLRRDTNISMWLSIRILRHIVYYPNMLVRIGYRIRWAGVC